MKISKQNLIKILWYAGIFFFFYIWFSQVHPLVVYDMDDWTYLAYIRPATPVWGDWNPAKIFPEVMMPFFSTLGRYLIYPVLGDYISAQTVTHALVVSGFITLYAASFAYLMKRIFSLTAPAAGLATLLFLTFHFLVFRTQDGNNSYLFSSADLNCYYNYVIPGLINASLVMYLLANHPFQPHLQSKAPWQQGILLLILYLAIFSNLTDSGILAAYAGACLVVSLWKNRKHLRPVILIKQNVLSLGILLAWFISAVFELSGGRAGSAGGGSFPNSLRFALVSLFEILLDCNKVFWLCVAVIIAASLIRFFCTRKKLPQPAKFLPSFFLCLIAAAAQSIYTLALCAAVTPSYIFRSEYLFPPFFFYLLLVFLGLGYLLSQFPRLPAILPLVLLVLIFQVNTHGKTFRQPNMSNLPGSVCAEVSRGILKQILLADQQGLTEMDLYLPLYVSDPETMDNWPYSQVLVPRISSTLYEHGLIGYPIEIHPVPSADFNRQYHLPIP